MKGCDDYLKKPVDLDELILRIKAIFKRENKGFEDIVLEENLIYNKKEKRLYKEKNDLKLPIKVLELLELLEVLFQMQKLKIMEMVGIV